MIVCQRCAKTVAKAKAVRVWDGCDYCRNCAEKCSPTLIDELKQDEEFTVVDDYYSLGTIALKLACYSAITTSFFNVVLFAAGLELLAQGKWTILEAIFLPPLLSLAMNALVYILVFVSLLATRNPRSKLTIANGAVSYSRRNETYMSGRWEDFSFQVYSWNAEFHLPWRTPVLYLIYRGGGFWRTQRAELALSESMYNRFVCLLALTAGHR